MSRLTLASAFVGVLLPQIASATCGPVTSVGDLVDYIACVVADDTNDARTPLDLSVCGTTIIDTPGSYVVTTDFALYCNEDAIWIQADDVTLDLGGHNLNHNTIFMGYTAIEVEAGRRGVLIRNGIIRGFNTGVHVLAGSTVRVEDVRFLEQFDAVWIEEEGFGVAPAVVSLDRVVIDGQDEPAADGVTFGSGAGRSHEGVLITNSVLRGLRYDFTDVTPTMQGVLVVDL